jgi:hypothetical protein
MSALPEKKHAAPSQFPLAVQRAFLVSKGQNTIQPD